MIRMICNSLLCLFLTFSGLGLKAQVNKNPPNFIVIYSDDQRFGKPTGWGGPWYKTTVKADEPSDPYLMNGFDQKVLHLKNESDRAVEFKIQVDFIGSQEWTTYETVTVPAKSYVHHVFPSGYHAHWVRLVPDRNCVATAIFFYN
jgi:hypothetical protein